MVRASLVLALPLSVGALGNVGALANAAGQVVERYTYDPYGQVTVRTGSGGTGLPRQPATYQFDSDRDGLLTDADLGYLDACLLYENLWLEWWPCVFYHDANHNGLVDVQDRAVFGGVPGVTEPGSFSVPPPPEFLRDSLPAGDGDADGDLDLWDYWTSLRSQGIAENDYILIHDLDGDQWVDQDDTYLLVASMEGPGQAVPEPGGPSRYGNPFLYTGQRWDPATGLYHFWGRSYDPALGRWLQRDLLGALAASGDMSLATGAYGPSVGATQFGPGDEYGDGFSLYQYVNSNPANRFDPYGLYDWFDETDDLLDELTGHKLYALGMLNEGAKWAALGLNMALDIGGSLLGVDVFQSVAMLWSGQGGFWEVMDIAMAVTPVGKVAKLGGILGKAHDLRKATRAGRKLINSIEDLYKFTARWKRGYNQAKRAEAARKFPHFVGKIENHHIIPEYLGGKANGPTVKVDKAYHQLITNEFRTKWKYKKPHAKRHPPAPADLEDILDEVYGELPLPPW